MHRLLLLLALLLTATAAAAGSRNAKTLMAAANTLDRALEGKDSNTLKRVLSPELQYGHSNGWTETKAEVIADLYNGKLTYNRISGKEPAVVIEGNTGLVRDEVIVDILFNGKPMVLKLAVLQVWVYKKGDWILIGRQSVKLG